MTSNLAATSSSPAILAGAIQLSGGEAMEILLVVGVVVLAVVAAIAVFVANLVQVAWDPLGHSRGRVFRVAFVVAVLVQIVGLGVYVGRADSTSRHETSSTPVPAAPVAIPAGTVIDPMWIGSMEVDETGTQVSYGPVTPIQVEDECEPLSDASVVASTPAELVIHLRATVPSASSPACIWYGGTLHVTLPEPLGGRDLVIGDLQNLDRLHLQPGGYELCGSCVGPDPLGQPPTTG